MKQRTYFVFKEANESKIDAALSELWRKREAIEIAK